MTKTANNPKADRFNEALASALSVSRSEIQERLAQAKDEKPSPHTKYTYVPAKPQS
jgi:hypothetical protein